MPFSTPIFRPYPFSDLCCTPSQGSHRQGSQHLVNFSSNDIFWILLFLYYSFGVEKKKRLYIRYRGSLENHTQLKTIMVKIYTRFQTKLGHGQNHILIKVKYRETSTA